MSGGEGRRHGAPRAARARAGVQLGDRVRRPAPGHPRERTWFFIEDPAPRPASLLAVSAPFAHRVADLELEPAPPRPERDRRGLAGGLGARVGHLADGRVVRRSRSPRRDRGCRGRRNLRPGGRLLGATVESKAGRLWSSSRAWSASCGRVTGPSGGSTRRSSGLPDQRRRRLRLGCCPVELYDWLPRCTSSRRSRGSPPSWSSPWSSSPEAAERLATSRACSRSRARATSSSPWG